MLRKILFDRRWSRGRLLVLRWTIVVRRLNAVLMMRGIGGLLLTFDTVAVRTSYG